MLARGVSNFLFPKSIFPNEIPKTKIQDCARVCRCEQVSCLYICNMWGQTFSLSFRKRVGICCPWMRDVAISPPNRDCWVVSWKTRKILGCPMSAVCISYIANCTNVKASRDAEAISQDRKKIDGDIQDAPYIISRWDVVLLFYCFFWCRPLLCGSS